MRLFRVALLAGLISAASLSTSARSAQPARALVQVLVLGADGQPLAGLTRGDFRVTAGGQSVAVESVEPGPAPASLVVLFDVSASLDGNYGKGDATTALRATLDNWLTASPAPVDRWRFGSFAQQLRMGSELSSDAAALRAATGAILNVPDAERFGPSPAWDAADAGVTALEGERGRRSVVLITDGRSTGNRRGLVELVRHAVAAGVPISVIGPVGEQRYTVSESTALIVNSTLGLQTLAAETGGAYFPGFGRAGGDLPPRPPQGPPPKLAPWMELQLGTLERTALETRMSYVIGLSLPATTGPRHLEVTVSNRPGTIVRAPGSIVSR